MKSISTQIGGDHYRRQAIQPIEFILANGLGFAEGNIVKYVSRWRHKGGVQDLRKAQQYLRFMLETPEYLAQMELWPANFRGMTYDDYCFANDIRNPEKGVITHIWLWNRNAVRQDLVAAGKWLDELIANVTAVENINDAR